MTATSYSLGGLRIVSDISLCGLQTCSESAPLDVVVIRREPIPEAVASGTAILRHKERIGSYNGREVIVDLPTIGRFLLRNGEEIIVDPEPSADDDEIRVYLLGTVFGLLCHQRGNVPLHAAAIDVAGGCAAFIGPSGAGKSTLIAALADRGHQVIADDVCFQQLDDSGVVKCWPGTERIRLADEAMHALGCDGAGIVREMREYNKYFLPIRPPQRPAESRRLLRVYELQPEVAGAAAITRLHGAAAIEVLMQNVYRLSWAERLGYKPRAFSVCSAAARNALVFRFNRPFGFDVLIPGIEQLEEHLREPF